MLAPSATADAKPQTKPYMLADERGVYLLAGQRTLVTVAFSPSVHPHFRLRNSSILKRVG